MRRVAITGLGVVSPLGNDVETFWNNIKSGKCGIGDITKFDTTNYKVKVAAEVKDFDVSPYMEKMDILHSDIYTHFAMGAACQAMEDSGIQGTVEKDRIGVMIGSGIGGIDTFMKEHNKLIEKGPKRVSPFFIPMMIPNMASSMIAIKFGCMGPALPAVTACASGSNAIGEAMRMIRHGYVDAMIA
ncbi:MAG: beta-ketoacyl-[acyl-carrier-protein] synthase II, partial [Parasporobacterium sp.]|nr:beta-ketoacyl-[acyl-carrier-protein] synthase II [Parasporobacterium sp.]